MGTDRCLAREEVNMHTDDSDAIERIRALERQKDELWPRDVDGLCPYYREHIMPRNPLWFTTSPRAGVPVGDNGTLAVFSTLGL